MRHSISDLEVFLDELEEQELESMTYVDVFLTAQDTRSQQEIQEQAIEQDWLRRAYS